jgi:hypothetical protein
MIKRLLVVGIMGLLSFGAFASEDVDDGMIVGGSEDLLMAGNPRQERRGGRQDHRDDKQDCRQEEGRIGDDKRECKHEGGDEGDEKDEAEAEG